MSDSSSVHESKCSIFAAVGIKFDESKHRPKKAQAKITAADSEFRFPPPTQEELEGRVRTILHESGVDWDILGPGLRRHQSIILGSTVHAVMFRPRYRRAGVDIGTPPTHEFSMADLIQTELKFTESAEPVNNYPGYAGFVRVRRFHKDHHSIYLIVVANENAATIIFNLYSTMDMNFVSGYGLFCAYPELTLNKLSYVNPSARDTSTDGSDFRRLAANVRRKGFTHNIALFEHVLYRNHVCGSSRCCPNTLRSMHDSDSLFVSFASTLTECAGPTLYDGIHTVIWSLGGPPCIGEGLVNGLVAISVPVYQHQAAEI
ncbi:hypothetical protein R3P38DRAFT_3196901 [Favolaschia claudopus]|uniref:Uncharacterized protein n=1 Tax=Favolaschia claudopus TaxID=2862362 RepID=A0AAW0B568_9AGAR